MKKTGWIFTFLLTGTVILNAQPAGPDRESQHAMNQIAFMVGSWEGTGWMTGRDGTRHNFTQTEEVQFKLDSTVILVEGLGRTGEAVTHNALAVISYLKEEQQYTFRSYLSSGLGGTFAGELIDGAFYWYPGEKMRYVLRINEEGQWHEKGEMNRDGTWFPFLEMTLDKVD